MTTEDALLAAVIANPADDLPRLVFADWLDENGQPERAEFIRVQCELGRAVCSAKCDESAHWVLCPRYLLRKRESELFEGHYDGWFEPLQGDVLTVQPDPPGDHWFIVRRGFVSEIRCTLADWCGGECAYCEGDGRTRLVDDDGNEEYLSSPCSMCGATGRIPGIGPQVVASHPVERVVVTDREPQRTPGGHTTYWRRLEDVPDEHHQHQAPNLVPAAVFDSMEGGQVNLPTARWGYVANMLFPTREDAIAALSAAVILWAKSQPHPARLHLTPVSADLTHV